MVVVTVYIPNQLQRGEENRIIGDLQGVFNNYARARVLFSVVPTNLANDVLGNWSRASLWSTAHFVYNSGGSTGRAGKPRPPSYF